ncbi:hypothetical protein NITHO_1550002 [Nitrolancea hollandica Lb]|uniref:Uncharacterized protein n=1 Tax=Nitrolancea hollandica Lb TaxID=1129897 RepID=I4EDK1_9BACT|nr:hypothetical protein NITHO_1550002 [Nitrolancea hollandica Lb]
MGEASRTLTGGSGKRRRCLGLIKHINPCTRSVGWLESAESSRKREALIWEMIGAQSLCRGAFVHSRKWFVRSPIRSRSPFTRRNSPPGSSPDVETRATTELKPAELRDRPAQMIRGAVRAAGRASRHMLIVGSLKRAGNRAPAADGDR